MSKVNNILINTLLALSTGLFTGGVVAGFIRNKFLSSQILEYAYFPAFIFYFLYIVLNVFKEEKKSDLDRTILAIITFLVVVLFIILIIIR
jgi:hypothetical protein